MHIFVQNLSKIFSSYKLKLCTHWTKTFLFPLPHPENKCSCCCCWLATQLYLTLCDPMDYRCLASLSFTIFQSLLKPMSISWWCHPIISSSVFPFSCLQSFPASGSFQISCLFTSVAKALKLQLQHQSFRWIFRTDFL